MSKQTQWVSEPFKYAPKHAEAFVILRKAVQSGIATASNRQKQYHLATDASNVGTSFVFCEAVNRFKRKSATMVNHHDQVGTEHNVDLQSLGVSAPIK